jgi:AraC-like DNA-binding protein
MTQPRTDPPRGLLNLDLAANRVRLGRYLPSSTLSAFVEHYWTVQWDLRGYPPFTSESLPYPSVHLVLQDGDWHVTGVPTGRFSRTLTGEGQVFGVKFKPGGFRPFIDGSVSTLTDRSVPADPVLEFAGELDRHVEADTRAVEQVESVLGRHLPDQDPRVAHLGDLVEAVSRDRSIVRVEQLLAHVDVSMRALQRLFREYIGVGPKWVIQRYRLFEAAERLAAGDSDGAQLAQELGYFDQAHFIRDFKSIVGRAPREYTDTLKAATAAASASTLIMADGQNSRGA